MNPDNLAFFARELLRRTGLVIGPEKAYLVETRLAPLVRRHGMANSDELIAALRSRQDDPLAQAAFDALMTHETFFFRDNNLFLSFRQQILPELIEARASVRKLRVWCAAASTGQEPYSLAMIFREESARLAGWSVEVVGTDISAPVLAYAREGLYTQFEVQRGLPIQLLTKYFTKEGDNWRLSSAVRNLVSYRQFNLLDDPSILGSFDVIFCRNVLIYFDQPTKAQVFARLASRLNRGGYLYLGGAETVFGITDCFAQKPGFHGVYALAPGGSAPAGAAPGGRWAAA